MKMTPFSKFKNNAVIIMGFPRSGTTLLSALLDYHPQLSVYPDKLHFPRVVYHEMAKRPLGNEEKLKMLFAKSNLGGFQHDKYEIPEHPEEVRDYSDIDYNTFYKKLNERVSKAHNNKEIYLSVIESFYDVEQSDKGDKKAWVEKTSINYLIYPLLKKWFGNNLVCLHIVRNPYDNFVSYRKFVKTKLCKEEPRVDDFCFDELDAFLWFGEIDRSDCSYHIKILEAIGKKCKVINNPEALKIGLDKFTALELLRKDNIKVPDIMFFSNEEIEKARKIFKEWKEVVIKPKLGSFGIGMVRINDEQTFVDVLDYGSKNKTHYVEKYIPNNMDEWIGVNVINCRIIYGYGKEASQIKNWKVQDRTRSGGNMILRKPNEEQRKIALKVGKNLGLDIYGVDIIKGLDKKYYVVDVNTFPGLYPDLLKKSENDMYKEIVKLVIT